VVRSHKMGVRRDLGFEQRHGLAAASLAQVVQRQARALSRMHRGVALHIRQREIGLAVTAVGRSQQGEERRVLRERQYLAVAKGPAFGCKVEGEDSDFSYK